MFSSFMEGSNAMVLPFLNNKGQYGFGMTSILQISLQLYWYSFFVIDGELMVYIFVIFAFPMNSITL